MFVGAGRVTDKGSGGGSGCLSLNSNRKAAPVDRKLHQVKSSPSGRAEIGTPFFISLVSSVGKHSTLFVNQLLFFLDKNTKFESIN